MVSPQSPWWVDPKTQALAYNIIDDLYNIRREAQGIKLRQARGLYPTFLSGEAKAWCMQIESKRLRELEEEYRELETMLLNHPVAMLATAQRLPNCFGVAFLAAPPQVTTKKAGPLLKTSNWIANCFLVTKVGEKRHSPKIAKLCTSAVVAWITSYRIYRRILPEPVLKLLDEKRRQYEPVKGRRVAEIIALKDAVRVLIGNAWLVWTWIALEQGLITERDVVLPYHLAREPWVAQTLIDPIHTFTRVPEGAPEELRKAVREASWVKLVKRVAG